MNPGDEITVYSAADIPGILDDFPFDVRELPIQAQADILRVRLLRMHGGIWTDSTVLPILPRSMWVERYLEPSGFFVYMSAPRHWRMTNYLIMARPGNHFIAALDGLIRDYWTRPRRIFPKKLQPTHWIGKRHLAQVLLDPDRGVEYVRFHERWRRDLLYPVSEQGRESGFFPYFWQQYLMMSLVRSDATAAAIVDRMPYRLHELSHSVQHAERDLGEDFPKAVETALLTAPVQKLNWRMDWPDSVFAPQRFEKVLV